MHLGNLIIQILVQNSLRGGIYKSWKRSMSATHISPLSLNIPISLKVFPVVGHGGTYCISSTRNTWNDLSCRIACIVEGCLGERKKNVSPTT